MDDVMENFVGSMEAKGCRIADIQSQYLMTVFFHTPGMIQHWAANVVTDIIELV
jgi:hypothetical protein